MAIPEYGAAPLSKTFLLIRGLALICMIPVIGVLAASIVNAVSSSISPPREIIGTLVVTCLAALYSLISIPFFFADANLGLLIMTALDVLSLLGFAVIAIILGPTISFLNCNNVDNLQAAAKTQSMSSFTQSLGTTYEKSGSVVSIGDWAGNTRANCFETKSVWGLSIALGILFFTSSAILPTLWFKARRINPSKSEA